MADRLWLGSKGSDRVYGLPVGAIFAALPQPDLGLLQGAVGEGRELTGLANGDGLSVKIVSRTQDPQSRCSGLSNDVNVYSFALKPEEHQPSGTCNFSRIDTAHLEFSASATVAAIYAVNYNVLRVMSGMGGLAYSN